ncbi:MAG: hypothetical protein GY714_32985 [Desulfobacterales bacterium]|nr:hypothetical protein [Desulfobacterales bacterium]
MKNKKMAAALAAVTNYIKSEEESIVSQINRPQEQVPVVEKEPVFASPFSRWNSGGREDLMQRRTMMQMRLMGR